jgi:MFS transporter, FSR family, fosmidomycin resistance protein
MMTEDGVWPTPTEARESNRAPRGGRSRHPLDALIYRLARYQESLAQPTPPRDGAPEGDPDEWAAARTDDGLACAQRPDGDPLENWESALAAFQDALTVWTRERNPQQWALARANLGVVYRERPAGDRSENQEQAICALGDALSVWTRDSNPEEWAGARLNLGIAYWERLAGERSENCEQAIAAFEDALSVWTLAANPADWATAGLNLGIAYRERVAGNRTENRQKAVAAFKDALSVWTREANPEEWAIAQANLDLAQRERFAEWLENRVTIGPIAASDIKVVGLVSAAHFMSHFFQIVLPPLFPLLKEAFGVGYAELSIVMTLMYGASGLMQTPAGFLVDRLGPARVLIGGLGLYSFAVLLYGFAPNVWCLGALALVAGLGNCVFHPSDYAILSTRVEATRLGRAYGVHNLAGSLGWAAAPIAVLGLSSIFGWRAGLSIVGGVGLLLTLFLVANSAALTTERRETRAHEAATSPAGLFLSRPILVCFGYFTLLAAATVTLQAFLPSSLVAGFGISVQVATTALTSFLVGSALGMFVGGVIADTFRRHELIVAIGLITAAIVSLSIGILTMPVGALIPCIAVAGFGFGSTTPSRDLLVRGATPAGATGRVFGFVYSGLDLGSALTPPVLGLLLDHQLPRLVFVFAAIILVLATSSAFAVGRTKAEKRLVLRPELFQRFSGVQRNLAAG